MIVFHTGSYFLISSASTGATKISFSLFQYYESTSEIGYLNSFCISYASYVFVKSTAKVFRSRVMSTCRAPAWWNCLPNVYRQHTSLSILLADSQIHIKITQVIQSVNSSSNEAFGRRQLVNRSIGKKF